MSSQIGSRINSVKADIHQIEIRHQRIPGDVCLLAVSKTKSIADILAAKAAGQSQFGESYVQEAVEKITTLADKELIWHFIGPIQKNKTRLIAEHFDWVHSIDRLVIAERLNAQRPKFLPPIQTCIQVNIDNEASKAGVPIEQVQPLAESLAKLPQLNLRGLMTIPQACNDQDEQRQRFAQLRRQLEQLHQLGLKLDTLSMGMSGDLESAIAEGATIVRIGTSIFGKRTTR
jgi:pyridoxal phosphate enzyme (YggS family)